MLNLTGPGVGTCVPCIGRQIPNPWSAREAQVYFFLGGTIYQAKQHSVPNEIRNCTLFPKKMKLKSLSRVQLFATLWTVAYKAPLSMVILQARILE